ncbi:polyhydroxyalkanoic acid system family protein [Spongiibacter taiwanensis]|uniref:polyhydroxyalkanoic acid system family protein n=1 Tax=Spongiibacter taiwanensis TaxID=1748242 RepID=UPI0020362AE2|nr:polyhydroxyalkanoic acid system family protein [Spongiibacter taiwanensis]USA43562.1 polyhydroxyalkanoic acid system family protein [Spongiibacter taiwanensis]
MSTISVTQSHNKSVTEVRELVDSLAKKLDERYQLKSRWSGERQVELTRAGVNGTLEFDEQEVRVDIKLGLMMSAFKSVIRDEVERAMREKLV